MPDFFTYYNLTISEASQEEKSMIILGLMTGLKVQLALLEKDQLVYNGFWISTLRSNFPKPIGVIIRQNLEYWEAALDESMFAGWKEITNEKDLNIYLLKSAVGALQVTTMYDLLVKSSRVTPARAKEAVAKTTKTLLDFLEKEYSVS